MRQFMEENHISYYRLANGGIDAQTLQRIRHDKPITTETLGKICCIMKCQPGDLIEYIEDASDSEPAEEWKFDDYLLKVIFCKKWARCRMNICNAPCFNRF